MRREKESNVKPRINVKNDYYSIEGEAEDRILGNHEFDYGANDYHITHHYYGE